MEIGWRELRVVPFEGVERKLAEQPGGRRSCTLAAQTSRLEPELGNERPARQVLRRAIARMKRALIEYRVEGIETTIPFFTALMDHADFLKANFDTGFIDRNLAELTQEHGDKSDVDAAIAAAAILSFEESQQVRLADQGGSGWKQAGRLDALRDRS